MHNLPDISVGVDLSLSDLAGLTTALCPGKGGVVAVIDGNGDVVAHPEPKKTVKLTANKDAIELVAATNIDDPLVRTAIRDSNASQQSHRSFNLSGKDYISYFRPAAKGSIANWNIVSVAAVSDFTIELVATLKRSLLIAATVLALAVIGVAIMAIWNAPTEDAMHADNACRGALAAYHISEDLNGEFAAKANPSCGLDSAYIQGMFWSATSARDRMQYTCLGSSVNLAARIEGLNKFYGTQVLASDAVRRRATSGFLFCRVDIVEVKGTTVPVTIYELMGERGEDAAFYVGPDVLRRASKYEQAFDFYLHRDFSDALSILDELTEEQPDDPVVALLSGKCRNFISTPPPPSWNGATALDEK
ncbi:MAG: hypothetical protein HOK25_11650 [Rhodospirillaceae bacterium]|nr:hypothetical protein [Rhodospirillaceae bacterium]